jgi:hypothetical protein
MRQLKNMENHGLYRLKKKTIEKRINKLDHHLSFQDINLKEDQVKFIPINSSTKTYHSDPS